MSIKLSPSIVLIHPPVVKPCEPPAGVARLAGALRAQGVRCTLIDANIEGLHHVLGRVTPSDDTWSRRAHRHLEGHLGALRASATYRHLDPYRRAVADLGRLLALAGGDDIRLGLADYRDARWAPVRSADLRAAAADPERNPFFTYYQERLLPRVLEPNPPAVGISINFLSQALCAFALIGMLKRECPDLKIILGGGLITSWMQHPGRIDLLADLVDRMVAGPGERILLEAAGLQCLDKHILPDYGDLVDLPYMSPGFILPFSAADGCWWRRCAFCPERAERRPYHPLPHTIAAAQLRLLTAQTRPVLIHLLDNAVSPAQLKALAVAPPGAPWYGFVRLAPPLDDPEFCHRLAAAGCVMLKIGLESGSQAVLDRLEKGVRLSKAARMLDNLHQAGVATYVYLLFGTPAEDEAAARETLAFVADQGEAVDFLNLAIFNLPLGSPDAQGLQLRDFYDGDLALYRDFRHPAGWDRTAVRRFVERTFKKHPAVQPIVRRDPPVFTSNHAPFFAGTKIDL